MRNGPIGLAGALMLAGTMATAGCGSTTCKWKGLAYGASSSAPSQDVLQFMRSEVGRFVNPRAPG
jgi:hypothetical protein